MGWLGFHMGQSSKPVIRPYLTHFAKLSRLVKLPSAPVCESGER